MNDATTQIQSHFVRAGHQSGKRRDWSLFLFFRILSQAEIDASMRRLFGDQPAAEADAASRLTVEQFKLEFANPTLWLPSFLPEEVEDGEVGFIEKAPPARLFLKWLRAVVNGNPKDFLEELRNLRSQVNESGGDSVERTGAEMSLMQVLLSRSASESTAAQGLDLIQIYQKIAELANDRADDHGLKVLREGLVSICAYEIIRHISRAAEGVPVLRTAAIEAMMRPHGRAGDRSPIEVAFTYQGLRALNLSSKVLSSFPDVFKEGMAARAARLGDTGESAPNHWAGELGQPAVHGMLTAGFAVNGAKDSEWARARKQIAQFNEAGPGKGKALRWVLGLVFRLIGIELVHIELGQDPYFKVNDEIIKPTHRHEHFGFRDGISQPVSDLDLKDPPPGSGTPSRRGSWAPVAPGEIFLGLEDEDGAVQEAPCDTQLRDGGTYLVFRKLRQDVGGFRTYLAQARPASKAQQERLAAQFVGRWKNGVSLVRAPIAPTDFAEDQEADLNNFRYQAEDPSGRRCPLGAHIRRANPRDIGGQSQAKRHRILRRGMAYGGPFLAADSLGDGVERGILFIALNARIDLQFELIQSRWINSGEFLGQAGLGKCPLTGANEGRRLDQFLEANGTTPLNCLPAFVHTRGGDYFYAPGLKGLRAIAEEKTFDTPDLTNPKQIGHGAVRTYDFFSPDHLRKIGFRILKGDAAVARETMPPLKDGSGEYVEDPATDSSIAFIARYNDVSEVLSGNLKGVSVKHYTDASQRMMGGANLLIATDSDPAGNTDPRKIMKRILKRAWELLDAANPAKQAIESALDRAIVLAVRRTKQVGFIDLVQDLAVEPLCSVIETVYGVRGPNWLTELAVSLPFGRQHISELHPDWLAMLSGKEPSNPRLATLQIWSILCFSDLIGNLRMQQELKALSMQAGSEFAVHLDQLLASARTRPVKQVRTLVDAFLAAEPQFVKPRAGIPAALYYRYVRLLLAELIASAIAVIPATFGSLMMALLTNRANLGYLVDILGDGTNDDPDAGIKRLIYETNRLSPSLPLLQRYATENVKLPSGDPIEAGEWIGVLTSVANFDDSVFNEPTKFSLHPFLPGPVRDLDKYLMFGPGGTDRACWGQDKLAMLALIKFVRAAASLPGLRRVAGPGGGPIELIRSMVGLPARFARH